MENAFVQYKNMKQVAELCIVKVHNSSLKKKSFDLWFQKIINRKFTYNFMYTNLKTGKFAYLTMCTLVLSHIQQNISS